MNVVLGISLLVNFLLALVVILREREHQAVEEQKDMLNRCLREELVDLIRRGRLLV